MANSLKYFGGFYLDKLCLVLDVKAIVIDLFFNYGFSRKVFYVHDIQVVGEFSHILLRKPIKES